MTMQTVVGAQSIPTQSAEVEEVKFQIIPVSINDKRLRKFIRAAEKEAANQPESKQPYKVATVIFDEETQEILGKGNNYHPYHADQGCEKRKQNLPSYGDNYKCCPGCDTDFHSEPVALRDAIKNGHDVAGKSAVLVGHAVPCKYCTQKLNDADVEKVYVIRDAVKRYNIAVK